MIFYAIDPDTVRHAVARFQDGSLTHLGWWRPGEPVPTDAAAIVIEQPHAIAARGRGQDPDDIVQLGWAGGEALATWTRNRAVPHTLLDANRWSTVPKPVRHGRTWHALTQAERALFAAHYSGDVAAYIRAAAVRRARSSKTTGYSAAVVELLDACSIGIHVLNRIGRFPVAV